MLLRSKRNIFNKNLLGNANNERYHLPLSHEKISSTEYADIFLESKLGHQHN